MSTQQEEEKKQQSFWQSITQLDRVKQVLRDYGVVAMLFHTSMSLCVLGGMYTLVDQWVIVLVYIDIKLANGSLFWDFCWSSVPVHHIASFR